MDNELTANSEHGYVDNRRESKEAWEHTPEHPSEEDSVEHGVDDIDSAKEESNDQEIDNAVKSRDASEQLDGGRVGKILSLFLSGKLFRYSLVFLGIIGLCLVVLWS